jgi:drug/metabolite transporter (DMT)-like permease
MFKGIALGLSACFIWGLIFIIPQFMGSFNPVEIVIGRYLCFGAISLVFLLNARFKGLCRYPSPIWLKAFLLSLLSGYYLWVILAIRYTSPEICALILGISPITIAFYGNWKEKEGNFKLLIVSSVLIMIGLVMINLPHINMTNSFTEYAIGLTCSLIALISWSVYVVLNSEFLKKNAHVVSSDWATMQGVTTFLWVFVCTLLYGTYTAEEINLDKYFNVNNEAITFWCGCLTLGLVCSWVGGNLWNKASLYLPVSLVGQLMIFETIFGVIFVYILSLQLPSILEFSGIMLLIGTIIYGIRNLSQQPHFDDVHSV